MLLRESGRVCHCLIIYEDLIVTDDHETAFVDCWPDEVLRDDHPTSSEQDCVSAASVEGRTTPTYAALAEICDL